MKPRVKKTSQKPMGVLEWLNSIIPDTPEMQAIEAEEIAKYKLADALSKARDAAKLTQAQLAKKLGVPQSLISRWENINHNHTLETLLKLCDATDAQLVLGLVVKDELIPVTPAAEDCVALSKRTSHALKARAARSKRSVQDELTELFVPRQTVDAKGYETKGEILRFSPRERPLSNSSISEKVNAA
jgi:transcriptional regulator with XRE-family HTH domain